MAFDEVVESDTPVLKLGNVIVSTNADITTWPWPRMIQTKYHVFLLTLQTSGELYLSELLLENGRLIPTVMGSLGLATLIETVDIADFDLFYVISTFGYTADEVPKPSIKTYTKDLNATEFSRIASFSTPTMGAICNYKNQFVGSNLVNVPSSIWSDLSSDGIIWSGIGNFELDPTVDYTAGFRNGEFLYSEGRAVTIYKLLPLDSRYLPGIVVYSNVGKFLLTPESTPTGFTYGVKLLGGLGVSSGNHIAGDDFIHGFIDTHRDFWTLESPHTSSPVEGNFKKLGYRDYILELFDYKSSEDHRVIVSYVPKNKRFYISNGNKCLIINEFGACHSFQCVSSVIKASDGRLYGTFKNLPDTSAYIVSDELDFGTRGLKSIESIFGSVKVAHGEQVSYAVDYQTDKQKAFSRLPYRNSNPRGEARIGVTAAEFRLVVSISDYTDAQIDWLLMNVKFSDSRFRRGPTFPDASLTTRQGQPQS